MVREHVAQLWSRRRNQKGMDYAKGRAMIGKFEMGQIVPPPGAPTNESAANSPETTIQEIRRHVQSMSAPDCAVFGGDDQPLCNLYSATKGQQAIRELAGALRDWTRNLPPLYGIFPDYFAPNVRNPPD